MNFISGSQFKRLAVPLGLMSAGASVCYPAQTVAVFKVTLLLQIVISCLCQQQAFLFSEFIYTLIVFCAPKVTGKKVYAVGQWSSAAVSSLLTPKPQEPVAKEVPALHPEVNRADLL